MENPSATAQIIGWIAILAGLIMVVAVPVVFWRNRPSRRLHEEELHDLLEQLIEDFTEITARRGCDPQWYQESARLERERRLAALHSVIPDQRLDHLLAECRCRYLECRAIATASEHDAKDGEVAWTARRGTAAATDALNLATPSPDREP